MPSVRVPLKGAPGWSELMTARRAFWAKDDNNVLSPHFRAYEFYCNDGSACPILARPALIKLCKTYLEPMRTMFGTCLILSGYRHQLYNARIGGAKFSQHIYEMNFESVAADVRFAKGNPVAWAGLARELREKYAEGEGGVGMYPNAGFVHVDNRNYRANW